MKRINGWLSRARGGVAIAAALVLAACCDEAAQDACRQREAQLAQLAPVTPAEASPEAGAPSGPFRLEVRGSGHITLDAQVVSARCEGGKGKGAEVKLSWQVSKPGSNGVRIKVGTGSSAGKVWMEAGARDEGVTGPWVEDGTRLVLEDQANGELLAEVLSVAQPCDEGSAP